MNDLRQFSYNFNSGPLPLSLLKKEKFNEGNCRLAVQYYFYKIHNTYLKPELVLNPKAYNEVGKFVVKENEFLLTSLDQLQEGDIIYADRLGKKKNYEKNEIDWIVKLHTAIYLGNNQIWHSTIIDKKSCQWSFEKFIKYYKPIAVKRIVG